MKTTVRIALLLVTILCLAGWTLQKPAAPRQPWEYKVLFVDDRQGAKIAETESMLNDLGSQGWELVQYRPLSAELAGSFHFKRLK